MGRPFKAETNVMTLDRAVRSLTRTTPAKVFDLLRKTLLPAYQSTKRCPKCDSGAITRAWAALSKQDAFFWSDATKAERVKLNDVITVTCKDCTYWWREASKDYVEPPEPQPKPKLIKRPEGQALLVVDDMFGIETANLMLGRGKTPKLIGPPKTGWESCGPKPTPEQHKAWLKEEAARKKVEAEKQAQEEAERKAKEEEAERNAAIAAAEAAELARLAALPIQGPREATMEEKIAQELAELDESTPEVKMAEIPATIQAAIIRPKDMKLVRRIQYYLDQLPTKIMEALF